MTSSTRLARIRRGKNAKVSEIDESLECTIADALRLYRDLLERINIEKIDITTPNDVYKITNAFSGLLRAKTETDRWKAEKSGMIQEACDLLTNDIKILLGDNPELMYQLLHLLDDAAQQRTDQLPE